MKQTKLTRAQQEYKDTLLIEMAKLLNERPEDESLIEGLKFADQALDIAKARVRAKAPHLFRQIRKS